MRDKRQIFGFLHQLCFFRYIPPSKTLLYGADPVYNDVDAINGNELLLEIVGFNTTFHCISPSLAGLSSH